MAELLNQYTLDGILFNKKDGEDVFVAVADNHTYTLTKMCVSWKLQIDDDEHRIVAIDCFTLMYHVRDIVQGKVKPPTEVKNESIQVETGSETGHTQPESQSPLL